MTGPSDAVRNTLAFYEGCATDFARRTRDVSMGVHLERFAARLLPGARILDAGCGSGRDSLALRQRGFEVVSFDGATAMVRQATALLGAEVLHLRFDELAFSEEFDGIWACASLVHLPSAELPSAMRRLCAALRPLGYLYVSFKHGQHSRTDEEGRHFTDLDEAGLSQLLEPLPLERVDVWLSPDVRPERADTEWLNAIVRRGARGSRLGC